MVSNENKWAIKEARGQRVTGNTRENAKDILEKEGNENEKMKGRKRFIEGTIGVPSSTLG